MRTYIGKQGAVHASERDELFRGIEGTYFEDFRDLFLGVDEEPAEQYSARRQAARDVMADLADESHDDEIAMLNALYAAQLFSIAAVRHTFAVAVARSARKGKAA